MKATIELDDALYRRLKAEAALSGRKVRELVAEGVRRVLDDPAPEADTSAATVESSAWPSWVGSLRQYAANAQGRHDLPAIRASIVRGRLSSGE